MTAALDQIALNLAAARSFACGVTSLRLIAGMQYSYTSSAASASNRWLVPHAQIRSHHRVKSVLYRDDAGESHGCFWTLGRAICHSCTQYVENAATGTKGMRREFLKYLFEMPLFWLGITVLAGLIFVGDTITDLEIAFAVLYVSVILLSVRSGRTGAIAVVGAACAGLTILSYFLTRHGASQAGLINSVLSLVAIAATTYLAIRIEKLDVRARQAQSELARMSRLTIVGELGTSIAHEVSQPITAIAANGNAALRWLSATPADQDEARRAIERIVMDAGRAGDVIGRVRRLVARSSPSRDMFDLIEAITDVLELVRSEIRKDQILLRAELASDLPFVAGDRVQLQQVILNFIMNAIEALADVDVDTRELLVSAAATESKITVSVRDTGAGVPPATLDRIFEAFYTTKPNGMGMGLAISRSIIEAHGGTVYAAPNFPHGTVFGFTLPLGGKTKG